VSPAFGSPAIGDENVTAFERDHGLQFSAAYRDFLLAYNGGRPRPGWVQVSATKPVELQVTLFSHLCFDPNLPEPRCAHSLQFAARPPADYFPIAQPGSRDDSLLLIKVTGQGTGAIFLWPDKSGGTERPAPNLIAASFDELMNGLDCPAGAKPWMALIDGADVDGFRKWLDTEPDANRRDPASNFTPIEYAARAHDPDVPVGGIYPADVRLRRAGRDIVERLLARGADPGRAFRHAFFARNKPITKLLLASGLNGVPTQDLEDVRYYLRHRPAWADDELRPVVEKELKVAVTQSARIPLCPITGSLRGNPRQGVLLADGDDGGRAGVQSRAILGAARPRPGGCRPQPH
jgi:hypothetical protein